MQIMLDKSPETIRKLTAEHAHEFWQLRTPLTGYRLAGVPYGLDNGAFTSFDEPKWRRQLIEARQDRPVFVCAPDIVGSARRTLELWQHFKGDMIGLPRALVLQDGIGQFDLPWCEIDAVFVGGSDQFKVSEEAFQACRTAKILQKWVHVGRVNTSRRAQQWLGLADSIDGSGLSQYDHMLRDVLGVIRGDVQQVALL